MMKSRLLKITAGLMLASALFSFTMPEAVAEEFSATSVQLLYGSNFHDPYFGNHTTDGEMQTTTLAHFGTWAYGDNFFFVDLLSGSFVDFSGNATGSESRIYAEWAPRLSLSQLLQTRLSNHWLQDLFIAGQINRGGEGFEADLIGLGADLKVPGFSVFSLNGYYRDDTFNRPTWQSTWVWHAPLGQLFSFGGYLDLNGTDNNGLELNTQPQLLLSLDALTDHAVQNVELGFEWYFHRHDHLSSSVLQAMVKWQW